MGISSQSAELAKTIVLLSKKPTHTLYLLAEREQADGLGWLLKFQYISDKIVVTDFREIKLPPGGQQMTVRLKKTGPFPKFQLDKTNAALKDFIRHWQTKLPVLTSTNVRLSVRLWAGNCAKQKDAEQVVLVWQGYCLLHHYSYKEISSSALIDSLVNLLQCGWTYSSGHKSCLACLHFFGM